MDRSEKLGDFTTSPRVLGISVMAIGIGFLPAYGGDRVFAFPGVCAGREPAAGGDDLPAGLIAGANPRFGRRAAA